MSHSTAPARAVVPIPLVGDLVHNWGWLLAQGILLVVLGTIGLGIIIWLTLASIFIFGVFLFIGGGVQILQTFKCRGWESILWYGLIAVLYVVAGFSIMADPLAASLLFTLLLAGALVGIGIVRLILVLAPDRGHCRHCPGGHDPGPLAGIGTVGDRPVCGHRKDL